MSRRDDALRCTVLAMSLSLSATAFGETIRVLAYEAEPFFYVDRGEPAGFEYELLSFFATARGDELQVIWVDAFDELLPMLGREEGDIAAAMLTRTPERVERYGFSDSYFPVRVVLVEPAAQKTESLESLAGATLATIAGSTQETLLSVVPRVRFVNGRNERELLELVRSGEARAAAMDTGIAFPLLEKFDGFRIGITLSETHHYGFGVAKGSPLEGALSRHIAELKASGIYYRLLDKHLGSRAVEAVRAGTER